MIKYRQVDVEAFSGKLNLNSDPLWLVMLSPSYAPQMDTHKLYTDLTNELPTGAGYTQGGAQLTGQALQYIPAANWTTTWTANAAHAVEDVVRPPTTNGYLYRCSVPGTSAATAPTWPTTVGAAVVDGTVTWVCVGAGVTTLTANPEVWAAPFTAGPIGYIAMVDKIVNPGLLIGLSTISPSLTGQGGSFQESFNASGIFYMFER